MGWQPRSAAWTSSPNSPSDGRFGRFDADTQNPVWEISLPEIARWSARHGTLLIDYRYSHEKKASHCISSGAIMAALELLWLI
jgi:hypothetical protein